MRRILTLAAVGLVATLLVACGDSPDRHVGNWTGAPVGEADDPAEMVLGADGGLQIRPAGSEEPYTEAQLVVRYDADPVEFDWITTTPGGDVTTQGIMDFPDSDRMRWAFSLNALEGRPDSFDEEDITIVVFERNAQD